MIRNCTVQHDCGGYYLWCIDGDREFAVTSRSFYTDAEAREWAADHNWNVTN